MRAVEVPLPSVLEPDRYTQLGKSPYDVPPTNEQLGQALRETGDYARRLWDTVSSLRNYLLASLPADERAPASPTGPDDDLGWQRWRAAFTEASSVLAGPHGDSGFGLSEAERISRDGAGR